MSIQWASPDKPATRGIGPMSSRLVGILWGACLLSASPHPAGAAGTDDEADSRAKRNGSSEADLHVFAKLREQGLERGEEAEALAGREIVAEHDLLQLGVAQGVQVEVPGQVAA